MGFKYKTYGVITDDIVTGYWKSLIEKEQVHGAFYLYISTRGHLFGIWAGDAVHNQKTYGYWALSQNRSILEKFVHQMEDSEFTEIDLMEKWAAADREVSS